MRILHIIYDDLDNPWVGGGGATRTQEIYTRIAREGHHVVVVCGNYPGAPGMEIRNGVRYRHVGLPYSHVLSRLTFMVGAVRLIKRGGYDIVIEDVSAFSPVGVALWQHRAPSIASVQNLSGKHASAKYGLLGWGPRLVEKPLLSLFKNFVAVSPGIAQQLREEVGAGINIRIIPNGTDPVFSEERAPGESDYILALGRIDVYQKGLDRLIEAFDLLADRLPNVRLLIAGNGNKGQVGALRSLVAEGRHRARITLLGQVGRQQAAQLMRSALLLAMPSRYEAWPLTALEAGAAGLPVVGTNIIGVKDAAPQFPQAHGELTPDWDAMAFAQAMYRVAAQPDLRSEMGRRGQAWAARFTWDAVAAEQLRFYRQALQ